MYQENSTGKEIHAYKNKAYYVQIPGQGFFFSSLNSQSKYEKLE